MRTLREIITSPDMRMKERKSVVGALRPMKTDIFNEKIMTPHEIMEQIEEADGSNSIFRSAIDTATDFIFGGDITFKSDDPYTQERGNAYIKSIRMNSWARNVIRETVKTGNGYAEIDYNPVTGLPHKVYPQTMSSSWYVNCDSHGEPLKTKELVKENGEYTYREVENLDEYFIQRIMPDSRNQQASWFSMSYYLDRRFKSQRIYGIPFHRDKMMHFKLNLGPTGVYGRSYFASSLNDNKILYELEKSIAILAKFKAVPRKVMQYGDKDNPATGEDLDDLIIYLEGLSRDEDPIVNKPIKMDDLSYSGGEINLDYMITHIRKKLTSGVVPDFLTGFGNDINRATAQVELVSYVLSIYSRRRCFTDELYDRIMAPWIEKEELEQGHLEFNKLDFETATEKTNRVLQIWTANLRPKNKCLEELGYEQEEDNGSDMYYTEWSNELMSRGMPSFGGLGLSGGNLALPEPQNNILPDNALKIEQPKAETLSDDEDDFPLDPAGMDSLIKDTASDIRGKYKRKLDDVKKISSDKIGEKFKEKLTKKDIHELAIHLKLGGADIEANLNASIEKAFLKGVQDGGRQINMIGGIPIKGHEIERLKRNAWKYVKKNIQKSVEQVEDTLYDGLLGNLPKGKLEKEIAKTYSFIAWKSEQLAVTELRSAYHKGVEYTMKSTPFKNYKFITAQDEKTCAICRPLHGRVFSSLNKSSPIPPRTTHPNCRCSIKIVKGE